MSTTGINELMGQMSQLALQARRGSEAPQSVPGEDFASLMRGMLGSVNDAQQTSRALATGFELGAEGIDLPQVMIASQKASLQFQTTLQVRNKLVSAYQDIMNMPV
ncbi:MAG: flagellar hook-basal body complex protein FliE [Candidatus Competibacteraceae bacterium]|nr:flagellar hook-basal body complex protein FliE [Candidatus Competibacteraceae bacterium]